MIRLIPWLLLVYSALSIASIQDVHYSPPCADASCNQAYYLFQKATPCDNTPGLADSYVLALNWQPAFCESYGYEAGKPECEALKSDSYAASHMVLHGLWPNQTRCGVSYGYCGVNKESRACHYPPVSLSETVAKKLKQFMPSYAYGSCLERHEWNRHGQCQILPIDDYFLLAIKLNEQLNSSSFGMYLKNHVGQQIKLHDLKLAVDKAFGKDAQKKIYFGCKNGLLVDMYINLPALLPNDESLEELIEQASASSRSDGCPKQVRISDFFG